MITKEKNIKKFFQKNGFLIVNLFNKREHQTIGEVIKKRINERLNILLKSNIVLSNLKDYHKLKINNGIHREIVNPSYRCIKIKNYYKIIENNFNIKQIMEDYWGHYNFRQLWVGNLLKDRIHEDHCAFRLARPGIKDDVGGIHLDKHVGGIKNLGKKNLLTLWIPIVGFDEKYTLKFSPGSHKLVHPDKFIDENNSYISMTYNQEYTDNFEFIRPNLKLGQGIIINPNTLHGESFNFGINTRVSIELRLFNANVNYVFDE